MKSSPEVMRRRLDEKNRRADSGCIEWTGATSHGYGDSWDGEKTVRVHKAAWLLANGPVPAGMEVCHRCDNPRCLNVDHLFLATHAQNMADRNAKGPRPAASGTGAPVSPRGSSPKFDPPPAHREQ